MLSACVLSWNELQADQPLIDSSSDDLSMILLQVVTASAEMHNSAVLKSLRKALSEGRRYQNAWISCEKQLRVSARARCAFSKVEYTSTGFPESQFVRQVGRRDSGVANGAL
jgi:hypothetical protein